MNKKEAIELLSNNTYRLFGSENEGVPLEIAIGAVQLINGPAKVVVPKYIDEKIRYCKKAEGYGLFHAMDYCYQYKDSADWLESNEETFARAWLDGYEIEQEKLYTVEIPNPKSMSTATILEKFIDGNTKAISLVFTHEEDWKSRSINHLTEEEIKQDFEWAWDAGFAKEVE